MSGRDLSPGWGGRKPTANPSFAPSGAKCFHQPKPTADAVSYSRSLLRSLPGSLVVGHPVRMAIIQPGVAIRAGWRGMATPGNHPQIFPILKGLYHLPVGGMAPTLSC